MLTCMHEYVFMSVCACMHVWVCQMISVRGVCSLNLCHAASIIMLIFLSDCLTRAVISAVYL